MNSSSAVRRIQLLVPPVVAGSRPTSGGRRSETWVIGALLLGEDRALDEPVLVGEPRRLGAVLDPELAIDVR